MVCRNHCFSVVGFTRRMVACFCFISFFRPQGSHSWYFRFIQEEFFLFCQILHDGIKKRRHFETASLQYVFESCGDIGVDGGAKLSTQNNSLQHYGALC